MALKVSDLKPDKPAEKTVNVAVENNPEPKQDRPAAKIAPAQNTPEAKTASEAKTEAAEKAAPRKTRSDKIGSGGIHFSRPLVEFWFDGSNSEPDVPVTATAVNSDNGDVGKAFDKNDGFLTFTYPASFEGEDEITVTNDKTGQVIARFKTGHFKVADNN